MISTVAHEVVRLEVLGVIETVCFLPRTLAVVRTTVWILYVHIISKVEHVLNMLRLVLGVRTLLRSHTLELVLMWNLNGSSSIKELGSCIRRYSRELCPYYSSTS